MKEMCYIISIFVTLLGVYYIIGRFGVTLSAWAYYRAILLHYQLVVTLSVNLELHYRLMLHYRSFNGCYIIGRNRP